MRLPDKSTGNGRHSLEDRAADLYETPAEAVLALLSVESLPHDLWEPCAGRGAIVRVLRRAGHRVTATELVNYGDAVEPGIVTGMDFLAQTRAPKGVSCIITNPPYQIASEFVRHGLTLAPDVYVLMRLAFLEGTKRSDILDGHLARVYVFRDRLPMMHRDGWEGPRSTSAMAFCWMKFQLHKPHETVLSRISWREHAAKAA